MTTPAEQLLKLVLDKCQGASFSEIRFVSGMMPAYVDKEGPHFLEVSYLTQEMVVDIHDLCLSLADGTPYESDDASTYTFALRRLGRVDCSYKRRGNVASLVLARDDDAAETIALTRSTPSPTLQAKAKPAARRKK